MGIFGISFGGRKPAQSGSGAPGQASTSSIKSWGSNPFKGFSLKFRKSKKSATVAITPKRVEDLRLSAPPIGLSSVQPQPFKPSAGNKPHQKRLESTKTIDVPESVKDFAEKTGLSTDKLMEIWEQVKSMKTIEVISEREALAEKTGLSAAQLMDLHLEATGAEPL